ncbi:hypothetical protein [Eubacterium sp. 1001713B170207_170306_E7]|uniref:hypothetical protein n=1 Tax=Eubacterium sp. 1001713B170207_170306_E7 TaxID=2787097 RepID=UPI00189867FC|nr:hypothetical protein [Eubacterium sp. 1001713B170207_170306_E7]
MWKSDQPEKNRSGHAAGVLQTDRTDDGDKTGVKTRRSFLRNGRNRRTVLK